MKKITAMAISLILTSSSFSSMRVLAEDEVVKNYDYYQSISNDII